MLTITQLIYSLISDFLAIIQFSECDLIDKFNDMLIITHFIDSYVVS